MHAAISILKVEIDKRAKRKIFPVLAGYTNVAIPDY
jgi:hypothetical protein